MPRDLFLKSPALPSVFGFFPACCAVQLLLLFRFFCWGTDSFCAPFWPSWHPLVNHRLLKTGPPLSCCCRTDEGHMGRELQREGLGLTIMKNNGGFYGASGQRGELFLWAGAEMFSNHFPMRIGSCLPGRDVLSAQVSRERERILKKVIGKSDRAGEKERHWGGWEEEGKVLSSFKSNF